MLTDGCFSYVVFWVASSKGEGQTYYVKLGNSGETSEKISIKLPKTKKSAVVTLLTGKPDDVNTPESPNTVVPKQTRVTKKNGSFEFELPSWSVAVFATE